MLIFLLFNYFLLNSPYCTHNSTHEYFLSCIFENKEQHISTSSKRYLSQVCTKKSVCLCVSILIVSAKEEIPRFA